MSSIIFSRRARRGARARRFGRSWVWQTQAMLLHCSNLRPLKRIDLLLEAAARIRPRESFKLVILAGEDFSPFPQ